MSKVAYYRCWTVTCKTSGCNWLLFLDIIGQKDRAVRAKIPPLEPFTVTCPECKTPHSYGPSDLEERNLEDPPRDYRCMEFLEAVRKASEPPPSESNEDL
jgi:hypothetical protein